MAKSIPAAYDEHRQARRYGRDPARHSRNTSIAQHPALTVQATVSTITLMSATTPAVYGVQRSGTSRFGPEQGEGAK